VLAGNAEKGQIEAFAHSRFRGIEAPSPAPPTSTLYARQAFGITSGEKPIKVRLLFEPKLAGHVAEAANLLAVGELYRTLGFSAEAMDARLSLPRRSVWSSPFWSC
jgi:hypothetical protein